MLKEQNKAKREVKLRKKKKLLKSSLNKVTPKQDTSMIIISIDIRGMGSAHKNYT